MEITVLLNDDRSFHARVVGDDPISDLAVLAIEATDLTPAEFGNSDALRVGDAVAAIGDPLGLALRGTLTDGIIDPIRLDRPRAIYDALRRENERLKALANFLANHDDYKTVDAYIIARSAANEWNSSLTINRGSNAGITVGMCAITENGEVVGLVEEVGPNFAVIKTILDSSLQISGTVSESGYAGMVSGGYTSGYSDLLRMKYLPSAAVLRNDDMVVTAGSTVYPRNLILGYVVDAGFEDTGIAKYAMLRPAAQIGELEQVFVITSYEAN
jgi:rod shape-determining protein MreC